MEALRTRPAAPAGLLCAPIPPSIGEDLYSYNLHERGVDYVPI